MGTKATITPTFEVPDDLSSSEYFRLVHPPHVIYYFESICSRQP